MAYASIKVASITLAALLLVGPVFGAPKKRPPPDVELAVQSRTATDEQFLKGEAENGNAVTLSGELRLPNWNERLPVVILVHGSDGPTSGAVAAWRNILDKQGIATFRLDYFSGRNIKEVETDQTRLGFFNAIYDVYRSVEILAQDPRIDPGRILVMGFSRGGIVALYASMRRFHEAYGPKRGKIAAYLPFYPGCSFGLVDETDLVDAPIRAFHGEADDWVPVAPCRALIEAARSAGHDATLTTYPGARHAFDNPRAPPGEVIANAQTARNCHRLEVDGVIINTETKKPFSYHDACIELGPSVGYDKSAAEAAASDVGAFLKALPE